MRVFFLITSVFPSVSFPTSFILRLNLLTTNAAQSYQLAES